MADHLIIEVEERGETPRSIPVSEGLVFGRGPDRKGFVGLKDRATSRQHAGLHATESGWVLRAISAKNPIKVRQDDGEWVDAQSVELVAGVEFLLGRDVQCRVAESTASPAEEVVDDARTQRRDVRRMARRKVQPRAASEPGEKPGAPAAGAAASRESAGPGRGGAASARPAKEAPKGSSGASAARKPAEKPAEKPADPFLEVTFDPTIDRGQRRSPVSDMMSAAPRLLIAADGFRDQVIELTDMFQEDQSNTHWCYFGSEKRKAEKRGQRIDYEIRHGNLSSPHFGIAYKEGRFFVSDMSSTNRTFVRGRGRGTDYSVNERAAELPPFRLEELSPETYVNLADTIDMLFYTRVDEEQAEWHRRALRELVDRGKLTRQQAGRVLREFEETEQDHLGAYLLQEAYIQPADWFQAVGQAIQLEPFHKRQERLKWTLITFGVIVIALVGLILWILMNLYSK